MIRHQLKISLRKDISGDLGIVRCKTLSLWERILSRLLGERHRMMVIVPGDSVQSVSIRELPPE